MTAVELDHAAERAAQELARRVNAVAAIDGYAFAVKFMADLIAEHWRCIPPPPDPLTHHTDPDTARDATRRGAALARARLAEAGITTEEEPPDVRA